MTQTSLGDAPDVGRRMRARLDAARDAHQPVGLLQISVDRLERVAPAGHAALLAALDELLAAQVDPRMDGTGAVTGGLDDGRLVLLPGMARVAVEALARGLVRAARALSVTTDERVHHPTLSIGVAHVHDEATDDLDVLRGVAEAGLAVARGGGGDRMVHTDQYDGVRLELAKRAGGGAPAPEPHEAPAELSPSLPPAGGQQLPPPEPRPGTATEEVLIEKLREALATDTPPPEATRFQVALEELLREHPDRDPEHERADLLERRVRKLVAALELAEVEINRLRSVTNVEVGRSSIYREVQGLSADDPLLALKRELMARIFEANEALQGARTGTRAEPRNDTGHDALD